MDQYEQLAAALRARCPELEIREWEPMARHTTFRIGGPVRLMALPKTVGEAKKSAAGGWRAGDRPVFPGQRFQPAGSGRGI